MTTNGSPVAAAAAIKNSRPKGSRMSHEEMNRRMEMLTAYIYAHRTGASTQAARDPDLAYRNLKRILLQGKEAQK